jgi:hypothetical protein
VLIMVGASSCTLIDVAAHSSRPGEGGSDASPPPLC